MKLPSWAWRPWLLPAALGLVLVGLSATSGVVWWQSRVIWDDGAVSVAKEEADNLFTLDHRTADDDVDRVLSLATGTFKDEYAAQQDKVVDQATRGKLTSSASVPEAGAAVEYFADEEAQVLVALDVSSSAGGDKAVEKRIRLRVTLQREDDKWLVSGIEEIR